MKATVLSYEGGILWGTARVRYTPNWLERKFGTKERVKEFEWEGGTYWFGGERIWFIRKTGKLYGRFPEIDNFIRKQKYNIRPKEQVVEEKENRAHYDAFHGMDWSNEYKRES